jgi:alkylhydroperoxidase family enzyme
MSETLMSRTPRAELPARFHQAWDTLNHLTGEPSFVEVFAQTPELLDFVMSQFYARIFFGGRVDQRYKQLVRLKLSLIHGCRTCNKQNVPGALQAGFTQAQIDAIEDFESGPFADAEKAVLRYAQQMALTNTEGAMSPGLYRELRAHFSDAEILELGTCMAVIGGFAKLSFVLNLVEKEVDCPFAPTAGGVS